VSLKTPSPKRIRRALKAVAGKRKGAANQIPISPLSRVTI